MRTWTKPGPHQVIAAANNDDFSHSNGSRTAGSGEVGRGGEGGVGDGWDNQVISIPPRGLCLREALSLLDHHRKSAKRGELRASKAPMLRDGELKSLYIWAFGFPGDWLSMDPPRQWSVPDWWVHTPLPAITRLYEEALEALRKARGDDEAKQCIRNFMEHAGPGPNVIISDRTGILSKDACANSDQVALATSINSYAVQHGSNVPGSFFNIHHIDSHLRIREADGNESAPRFQPRGSMVSVDAGGGAIFSPQAAAAAPPVQPRLLEVAGSISAASLAGT